MAHQTYRKQFTLRTDYIGKTDGVAIQRKGVGDALAKSGGLGYSNGIWSFSAGTELGIPIS
jgi:hypothetical protein